MARLFLVAVFVCLVFSPSIQAQSITIDTVTGGKETYNTTGKYTSGGKSNLELYPQYYDNVNKQWKYFAEIVYTFAPKGLWIADVNGVPAGTYTIRMEMKYTGGSVFSNEKSVTVQKK